MKYCIINVCWADRSIWLCFCWLSEVRLLAVPWLQPASRKSGTTFWHGFSTATASKTWAISVKRLASGSLAVTSANHTPAQSTHHTVMTIDYSSRWNFSRKSLLREFQSALMPGSLYKLNGFRIKCRGPLVDRQQYIWTNNIRQHSVQDRSVRSNGTKYWTYVASLSTQCNFEVTALLTCPVSG